MNQPPENAVSIREATTCDIDTLVEYNSQLARETEGKELNRETLRAGLEVLLADSTKGKYLVAEISGKVVGQVMFTREWSDWRNGEFWWLQSVYIASHFRRQGIFKQLYQAIVERARARTDVVGIRLYVELQNKIAQSTYEQLGMQAAGYSVMETLELQNPDPA
ncbi:putative acetyltransferase [Polystyrenella longa]|uniref:Putative acetyltransferase n=1 Tax=Polystyrenella longa TaxID=2528007 RepID=A0A518CGP8_9PLAN|nr:GNAT family N-acetyltransferase [Polystyrenella longa]QDU78400.1 putative acetyltransferase [Polystyrenella longa]